MTGRVSNWAGVHPRQKAGPWAERAMCKGTRDLHYPTAPRGSGEYDRQTKQAKAMCGMCPVQRECLELALSNGERHGIWGGYSFPMPARIRRRLEMEGKIGA